MGARMRLAGLSVCHNVDARGNLPEPTPKLLETPGPAPRAFFIEDAIDVDGHRDDLRVIAVVTRDEEPKLPPGRSRQAGFPNRALTELQGVDGDV